MAIGELCTRDVVFVGRNDTVAEAARLMRENHIGSLVVAEGSGNVRRPAGMITDRDIAVGVVALGLDPESTTVEAAMRGRIVSVREDEGVGRAISLMRAEGVRRLPVVDASGALVGVIAADDLIDLFAEEMSGLAGMLSRGTNREAHERAAVRGL
ncbi:MAG TPA: CBS domain-containing protein [Usitatibacter sp.]|nr:CBS domain-containing protein [Usitatibacter sp.]